MDIKIGIQNVGRELTVNADLTAEEVEAKVTEALSSGTPLVLKDSKGNNHGHSFREDRLRGNRHRDQTSRGFHSAPAELISGLQSLWPPNV